MYNNLSSQRNGDQYYAYCNSLQNMLTVRRAGAVVLPASPGFYTRPADLVELADGLVQRILDHMGVDLRVHRRWREELATRAPRARLQGVVVPEATAPSEGADAASDV